MNKVTDILKKLNILGMKGHTIMVIYTFCMIGLSIYSTVAKKAIDGSVAVMYSTALTVFVASKEHKRRLESKQSADKPEAGDV